MAAVYTLIAISFVALLIVLIVGWMPSRAAARRLRAEPTSPPETFIDNEARGLTPAPGVSVIVLTDSAEEIGEYLMNVLSQDYKTFEVIVVARNTSPDNERITGKYSPLADMYPGRLKFCYVPPEARSVSRRKLAITIGAKAAMYDYMLITDVRCVINSPHWIGTMMTLPAMTSFTGVVLGCTVPDFDLVGRWRRPYVRMKRYIDTARWIGDAAAGYPWRGDGMNLLYERQLFFRNKGFGHSQRLINGDDDIFIDNIASGTNTRLSVTAPARLTFSDGPYTTRYLTADQQARMFTAKYLPAFPFLLEGMTAVMRWMSLLTAAAAIVLAIIDFNIAALAAAGGCILLLWLVDLLSYRNLASAFGDRRGIWGVPFLLLWRPIGSIIFRVRCLRGRYKNITDAF